MNTKGVIQVGAGGMGIMAIIQLALQFFTKGSFPDLAGILSAVVPFLAALGIKLFPDGQGGGTLKILQAIAVLVESGVLPEGSLLIEAVRKDGIPSAASLKAQWGSSPIKTLDWGKFVDPVPSK